MVSDYPRQVSNKYFYYYLKEEKFYIACDGTNKSRKIETFGERRRRRKSAGQLAWRFQERQI